MKFLEGWLFRPQGKPMVHPIGFAARLSQFPFRFMWHEAWVVRYAVYGLVFVTLPLFWQIDKKLTSKENKELWAAKRKHEREHREKELEKMWEVRT